MKFILEYSIPDEPEKVRVARKKVCFLKTLNSCSCNGKDISKFVYCKFLTNDVKNLCSAFLMNVNAYGTFE